MHHSLFLNSALQRLHTTVKLAKMDTGIIFIIDFLLNSSYLLPFFHSLVSTSSAWVGLKSQNTSEL